jgi:hypothetical protein
MGMGTFDDCCGHRKSRERHSGAMQSIEPGISRFRVWSFGPSRNDGIWSPREDQLIDLDNTGLLDANASVSIEL